MQHISLPDKYTPQDSRYNSVFHVEHDFSRPMSGFGQALFGAGLAAALAQGTDGCERVYIVEPKGSFENDPNVTDKKFPGNPTRSYRSSEPLKIIGEVTDWVRLTPEELQSWREKIAVLKADAKAQIIN